MNRPSREPLPSCCAPKASAHRGGSQRSWLCRYGVLENRGAVFWGFDSICGREGVSLDWKYPNRVEVEREFGPHAMQRVWG